MAMDIIDFTAYQTDGIGILLYLTYPMTLMK